MVRSRTVASLLAALLLVVACGARAATADVTASEVDKLKRDVEDLRRQLAASRTTTVSKATAVDRMLENKYGPDAAVTTRQGKLQISGLLQVWYTSYWNDHRGVFDDPRLNGVPDTNETRDNDSFRIRRTEIKFIMDIHENVKAVVMIDPAREATSFPGLPSNQGLFARANQVAPEFDAFNGPGLGSTANVLAVQTGAGAVPRLLQDAYINYHGVIPHHDVQIGQFKPAVGEEGIRSSAELDFVERSMIGQINDARDLGISVHGSWWDERFQYWVALFDGAGNYYGSSGQAQNRSDDNDWKDFNFRVLVRPLWENECWGTLEIGGSGMIGKHGESGPRNSDFNTGSPINGLNRADNMAYKWNGWVYYAPGSIARGLWVRAEYLWLKDRNAPLSVVNLQGADSGDAGFNQAAPIAFSSDGFYVAAGYRLSQSIWCDKVPGWLKPFEFAVRYEQLENVQFAAVSNISQTHAYATKVWTGGVNYYIKEHNAKIQLNYNSVSEPGGDSSGAKLHDVHNNNIVVNFQVAF